MNRIITIFLCLFCPILAIASSALSFTPPSTDYSVIFLGNIFGVVDGVLHGSGSQIMGKMFGVFNAAVLALGGIVVTYTLIVGTMNTSHEGQFLGQKWSSIWIPVRSTIGLALLIPKSSGYCLMQIFIMWVVVQGIGAADKVWNAALDYLNTGGVIVAAQSNSSPTSAKNTALQDIAASASAILQGQVCMKGIQTMLETARTTALNDKESGSGLCIDSMTKNDSDLNNFCNTPVPDFLSSVNFVEVANTGKSSVDMPNFTDSSVYQKLNKICGQIDWTKLDLASDTEDLDYMSAEDIDTMNQSRPIAIEQMYMDLTPVAVAMINNDPMLVKNTAWQADQSYTADAHNQYGIPLLASTQMLCDEPSDDCMNWGPGSSGTTQVYIMTGLEFMNALTDYNAIMAPVLNLQSQSKNAEQNNNYHAFITDSEAQGWIMAGTYFFDLAYLNGSAQASTNDVDSDSGLGTPTFYNTSNLTDPFATPCTGKYASLCKFLSKDAKPVNYLDRLIKGTSSQNLTANVGSSGHEGVGTEGSATTYGYINNSSMIHLPGQPGLATPQFKLNVNIKTGNSILKIPTVHFGCGFKILVFCVGGPMMDLVWNSVIKQLFGIIITFVQNFFDMIVEELLIAPLSVMMATMNDGVQLLNTTQTHPIVAMAYMGTSFINYCTELYFQILVVTEISLVAFPIVLMILPFLSAWMAIMFTIGFLDAYYVPFLPYMIFTFGSIAWIMAVIESMVAGPIVALGVTHPEGHDALGKAEQAVMILVNVFLRPAMMIVGYVAGIALCYVAVFIINSGFSHVMAFLMPPSSGTGSDTNLVNTYNSSGAEAAAAANEPSYSTDNSTAAWNTSAAGSSGTPYTNYAAMYAGFFCLLTYTTIYLTVVEKSFTLIYLLPDNVLRWIGGQPESIGKETAQWGDATKRQLEEGGKETGKAAMETSEKFGEGMGLTRAKAKKGKGEAKGEK